MHLGSRKSREAERNLEDAIFAAVGVFDQGGRQHINFRHADLLVRVCIQTESMPTLAEVTDGINPLLRRALKAAALCARGNFNMARPHGHALRFGQVNTGTSRRGGPGLWGARVVKGHEGRHQADCVHCRRPSASLSRFPISGAGAG